MNLSFNIIKPDFHFFTADLRVAVLLPGGWCPSLHPPCSGTWTGEVPPPPPPPPQMHWTMRHPPSPSSHPCSAGARPPAGLKVPSTLPRYVSHNDIVCCVLECVVDLAVRIGKNCSVSTCMDILQYIVMVSVHILLWEGKRKVNFLLKVGQISL